MTNLHNTPISFSRMYEESIFFTPCHCTICVHPFVPCRADFMVKIMVVYSRIPTLHYDGMSSDPSFAASMRLPLVFLRSS
jgi:hypothetical protein